MPGSYISCDNYVCIMQCLKLLLKTAEISRQTGVKPRMIIRNIVAKYRKSGGEEVPPMILSLGGLLGCLGRRENLPPKHPQIHLRNQ